HISRSTLFPYTTLFRSVWGSVRTFPGSIVRIAPGPNPSETALAEIYNVPLPGFGIRGADIDKQGVVWASLASGHLASFDRRKCRSEEHTSELQSRFDLV